MHYIIRDFDRNQFEKRKQNMITIAEKEVKVYILIAILN